MSDLESLADLDKIRLRGRGGSDAPIRIYVDEAKDQGASEVDLER